MKLGFDYVSSTPFTTFLPLGTDHYDLNTCVYKNVVS